MNIVDINVAPSYPAYVEAGLVTHAGERMRAVFPEAQRFFIITSAALRKPWGTALAASFAANRLNFELLEMKDSERRKSLSTVETLAQKLLSLGADRKAALVALGGGVVGDVTGFLASIYMRGVDFAQAPTTLLAQLDAAIGGKTGVDLRGGKNLLGTFHHPRAVFIDPTTLGTLPEREFRSGLYEALKCGIIANPQIFEFMEQQREGILQRDAAALEWLITECVRVKAGVVAADPREQNPAGGRRILNFGHTIGHALEAETGYKHFRHGEAVAWGMIAAALISAAVQRTDGETARRIIAAVLAYAPLPKVQVNPKRILKRLGADKKTVHGVVHFVLPTTIGAVEIVPAVPARAISQAVKELHYLSQG